MPKNQYCIVLGSSPNVQNLVSKMFAKYCKRLVSKVSCFLLESFLASLMVFKIEYYHDHQKILITKCASYKMEVRIFMQNLE